MIPFGFDEPFMQRGLLAGLAVALSAPLIGIFLVQRRLSLVGDGIGHLAFAGVAAGLALDVAPVWVALGVAVAGAVAIEWLRRRRSASGDVVLAVFFYAGIASGVVITSASNTLDRRVFAYLFGSVLTARTAEVWTTVALGLVIVAVTLLVGRALFTVVLDEESARVAGLPVDALNTILAVLTAVTIVAAMRVVGLLLVAAMMVLPVAAAQVLARSFRATMLLAVGIAVFSVIAGLAASRSWGWSPGGSIVLTACAVFAVTSAAALLRGRTTPARRMIPG